MSARIGCRVLILSGFHWVCISSGDFYNLVVESSVRSAKLASGGVWSEGSLSRGGSPLTTFAIQSVIPAAPIIDWLYTIAFHMILLHCTKQFRTATFYFLQEKKIERITIEKERKRKKKRFPL